MNIRTLSKVPSIGVAYASNSFINSPVINSSSQESAKYFLQNQLPNAEYHLIPKSELIKNKSVFIAEVLGDSMERFNIYSGDAVLFEKNKKVENGDIVIMEIQGNLLIKQYKETKEYIHIYSHGKDKVNKIKKDRVKIIGKVFNIIELAERKEETAQTPKLVTNQIVHSEAIKFMKQLPEHSIDLTVTSPPYDNLRSYDGYNFDFEGIAAELFRVTNKGGVLVWVVGDKIKNGSKTLTSFRQAITFQELGFCVHDIMIYKKKNTPFMRSNGYTNCFEFMLVLGKGKPKTFNPIKIKTVRQGLELLTHNKGPDGINKKTLAMLNSKKTKTNIWEYAVGLHGSTSDKDAFQHPAIFPEQLAEDHILSWSKPGDLVFDPMCGSGTTCKMAAKHKRHYLGCDISDKYVAIARNRIKIVEDALSLFDELDGPS